MGAELVVVNGVTAGQRVALGQQPISIGRAPDSNLQMADPDCGWRHCEIRPQNGAYLLVDHRTPAGTVVNGVRAVTHQLGHGDQIAVGTTVLVFEDPAKSSGATA